MRGGVRGWLSLQNTVGYTCPASGRRNNPLIPALPRRERGTGGFSSSSSSVSGAGSTAVSCPALRGASRPLSLEGEALRALCSQLQILGLILLFWVKRRGLTPCPAKAHHPFSASHCAQHLTSVSPAFTPVATNYDPILQGRKSPGQRHTARGGRTGTQHSDP